MTCNSRSGGLARGSVRGCAYRLAWRHPLYLTWCGIIRAVEDPDAAAYRCVGGVGVTICRRWRSSFANFVADVGQRPDGHVLSRRDMRGPYEPGNVLWLSRDRAAARARSAKVAQRCS